MRSKLKASQNKIKRLQQKIKEATTAQGITVDNDLHYYLKRLWMNVIRKSWRSTGKTASNVCSERSNSIH